MKLLVLISFLSMPFMAMGSSFFFEGKDYSGQNLDGKNFAGQDLYGADFRGASLRGANFEGADVRNADFDGANLSCANFNDAELFDGNASFIIINKASFQEAYMDSELWTYFLARFHISGSSSIQRIHNDIGEVYKSDDNCNSQQQ